MRQFIRTKLNKHFMMIIAVSMVGRERRREGGPVTTIGCPQMPHGRHRTPRRPLVQTLYLTLLHAVFEIVTITCTSSSSTILHMDNLLDEKN